MGGLERYTDPAHSFHERPGGPIDTFQWTANIEVKGEWGQREIVHTLPNEIAELSGVLCIRADLIHNFYAIRRATYEAAPSDYRCKVDEHLDHFLRLKKHRARVFYTPEVSIDHHSREYRADSTDPLEAKFAKVRNTGGQYHPFVRENWGLDPEKAWGIKITKVPFLDRRPKAPTAALTDAGRRTSSC